MEGLRKALFLDRDGIINVDHGYVHKAENFDFIDGIFELCHHAKSLGYLIIVVTNQAGIAKGYYSVEDVEVLTNWIKEEFFRHKVNIDDVYFCPHHPKHGENEYVKICNCRKPEPGMIITAQQEYNIELANSILIGDRLSDIKAAQSAGIIDKIIVESNFHTAAEIEEHIKTDNFTRKISKISEAIQFIN